MTIYGAVNSDRNPLWQGSGAERIAGARHEAREEAGRIMSVSQVETDRVVGRTDERLRRVSIMRRLMVRPELGAVAGTVLVYVFFFAVAGNSGMFSAKGILNFLEVSAQLGILASMAALLMIAGEFDLSVGS